MSKKWQKTHCGKFRNHLSNQILFIAIFIVMSLKSGLISYQISWSAPPSSTWSPFTTTSSIFDRFANLNQYCHHCSFYRHRKHWFYCLAWISHHIWPLSTSKALAFLCESSQPLIAFILINVTSLDFHLCIHPALVQGHLHNKEPVKKIKTVSQKYLKNVHLWSNEVWMFSK